MLHKLSYILDKETYKVLNSFSILFGIRIAFFDKYHNELIVGADKPICRFCQMLREHLGRAEACRKCDRSLFERCDKKKDIIDHLCHAGLFEAIKPVIIDAQVIGYIMIGQVRIQSVIYHELFDLWETQWHDKRLHEAYDLIPVYAEETLCHIMELFSSIVGMIIHERLIQFKEMKQFTPLIEMLKQNPEKHIRLEEAARMVHKSPSSFCRQFHQITGVSFRSFQIENRISCAEDLLRSGICRTVQEAAYECGFQNAFYFSRLFKKYRGYPPSRLIQTTNQNTP